MPAISPGTAQKRKIASIPEVVFTAVNEFLVKGGRYVTISQDSLLARLKELAPETPRHKYFDEGWLDFESYYRRKGWKVEYDKPGYNESYGASWEFTSRAGSR